MSSPYQEYAVEIYVLIFFGSNIILFTAVNCGVKLYCETKQKYILLQKQDHKNKTHSLGSSGNKKYIKSTII